MFEERISSPTSSSYLMISLSLKMQVDSNGGKANPSICAQETIHSLYPLLCTEYRHNKKWKKKNQINVHGKPKAFSMKPSLLKKTRKKAKGEKDPNKGDR